MKDENELPQNRSVTVPAESNNHKTIVFYNSRYTLSSLILFLTFLMSKIVL